MKINVLWQLLLSFGLTLLFNQSLAMEPPLKLVRTSTMVVYKHESTAYTLGITTQLRNDHYYDGDMAAKTLFLVDELYRQGWKVDRRQHSANIQIIVGAAPKNKKTISKSDLGVLIIWNNPGESAFITINKKNWINDLIEKITK